MSAKQELEDRFYNDKAVAKADYDKALAEWKNASPEDKPVFKEILDFAKDLLDAANKNLNDCINLAMRDPGDAPNPLLLSLQPLGFLSPSASWSLFSIIVRPPLTLSLQSASSPLFPCAFFFLYENDNESITISLMNAS